MLLYEIVDNYGQRVYYDNSTEGRLFSNYTLSGEVRANAINGILQFQDFIVTQTPNSNASINLVTWISNIGQQNEYKTDTAL